MPQTGNLVCPISRFTFFLHPLYLAHTDMFARRWIPAFRLTLLSAPVLLCGSSLMPAQQVLQRGALGAPAQVYDETQQWTTPLAIAGSVEQDVYIPDVSTPAWLSKNYLDFENKGVYTISFFTWYKRPSACRRDLVRWGFADAAHLDGCVDIGYRVRELEVDTLQKTVTLVFAAMVGSDGQLLQDANPVTNMTRRWAELDPLATESIAKTNSLVADQMRLYDRKMRGVH